MGENQAVCFVGSFSNFLKFHENVSPLKILHLAVEINFLRFLEETHG